MAVQEYWFDTEEGPRTLAELFAGRAQLLVAHFPFDAGWRAAFHSCSVAADRHDRVFGPLNGRGVTLVAVSAAPIDAIVAYKWRMGWSFPWVSSLGTGFDADCGVGPRASQPGLSAFALRDGAVHRTRAALGRAALPASDEFWGRRRSGSERLEALPRRRANDVREHEGVQRLLGR